MLIFRRWFLIFIFPDFCNKEDRETQRLERKRGERGREERGEREEKQREGVRTEKREMWDRKREDESSHFNFIFIIILIKSRHCQYY